MTSDERPGKPNRNRRAPTADRRGTVGRLAARAPGERGQAHTLEGVVAGLVVLSAVVFALEMTAVTPLSASTSSQHIENQQEATARGVLAAAAQNGSLERTVLFWNDSTASDPHFFNATENSASSYYTTDPPPTEFGRMLNRSFNREGIAYNVYLRFDGSDGPRTTQRLVYQGRPSDNAVRATWPVVVQRNDTLYDHEENPTDTTVTETSTFYVPKGSTSSVYNVVRVEGVVWRI